MKKTRILVQQETLKYLDRNKGKFKSQVVKYDNPTLNNSNNKYKTNIEIVPMDSLEATIHYQNKFQKRCAFLVMANPTNPGGGYKDGSPAQEESICRRTNLVPCINNVQYPIPEFGSIFINNIHIIRDLEKNSYKFLDKPVVSSCILCAAYSNPPIKNDKLEPKYRENTKKKIQNMFNVILNNNITNVVLSAFGCGAFSNPPYEIANIFMEVINSDKYKGRFENIIFAIIKDAWFVNYKVFNEVVESYGHKLYTSD